MGNIFITSDTHYNHDAIRVHCNRPFTSTDEMNEALIHNHNRMVKSGDTVIIVGDFAWSNHMHFIHALNGKKILVIGNHDRMSTLALAQFTEVIGTTRQPGIYQRELDGKYCVFCHFPLWSWNSAFNGSWHFYGHCHGRKPEAGVYHAAVATTVDTSTAVLNGGLSCDVGVDAWDYAPVPWDVLKLKMLDKVEMYKAVVRDRVENNYPVILTEHNQTWRERYAIKQKESDENQGI